MTTAARPAAPARPDGSEIKAQIAAQAPLFAQAARLSLAIGVLMLAPSWFMFEVYGRVLNSRDVTTLVWLLVAATVSYVVMELVEVSRGRVLHRAGERFMQKLNARVFDACFSANLRAHPGGTSQAVSDVRALGEFLQSPAVTGVLDLPASLLCLLLLWLMSPWLALLAMMGALLQVGLGVLQERRTTKPFNEAMQSSIEAQNRAAGILRNAQVVESMGMGAATYGRWMKSNQRFLAKLGQASDHAGGLMAIPKAMQGMQGSLLLGLGCLLTLHNALWGGGAMIIVASILGGRVLAPLAQLAAQWRQISGVQGAFKRLAVLLESQAPREPGLERPAPKGLLSVENLMAGPPNSAVPVLKGFSFALAPGETLMVIGPSAAGKSTLARLLVGVWPAQSGKVRLDGVDVYGWHKSQLGQYLGYLPQGVELFDGTLAENIARFGKVDMAEVRDAAERVGITDFIDALPQGYETRIGEDGAVLSGGQRQRVGLARAIYGRPRFIVLDEPNASLDEAGDRALLALLMRLKAEGCTVVAITHRTSVLPAADKIAVLNDGKLVGFGPRDVVLAALKAGNDKAQGQAAAQPAAPPQSNATVQGSPT